MADNFAIGKALEIPNTILKNIDALDAKMNNIAKNAEAMASAFKRVFASVENDANELNKRLSLISDVVTNLGKAQGLSGLSALTTGLGSATTQAERAASSITRTATSLNQFANPAISSSIKSMTEQIAKLGADIKLYYQSIGTGKKTYIDFGQQGLKEAVPQVEALMRAVTALSNAQSRLQSSGGLFKDYIDSLNGSTLAARRQKDEMEQLNKYFRQQEASSKAAAEAAQRQAAAQEKAAERERRAQEKAAQAAEKAAQRQAAAQAKLESRLRRSNYQSYVTSPEGALRTAERASSYTQRAQAIRNLNAAMNNLNTSNANYQKNLERLTAAYRNLTSQQENFNKNVGRVNASMSNAMNISEQLRRRIALIFSVSQITSFVTAIRDVTGEFELQNAALASILQNKNQADVLFQQVQDLAVRSPFTVRQLTTYAKSLSAYGLEYENLYDTLKRLADISSGLGVDMQRIILAYGQVQAANVLRGTETRQFSEAGLNILKELAEYYSEVEQRAVSLAEVQDRQFKKMISAEDVTTVLKRLTDEGGMFYQMQERQSETIAGMVSNLEDTRDLMYKAIGEDNREVITAAINSIKTLYENWRIFADIVKAGGAVMAAYTIKVIASAVANGRFTASALQAAAAQKGFNGAVASGLLGIKNFAAFSVNPWVLAGTAALSAALLIDSHRKEVERVREEYDILTNSLEDNKAQFETLAAKINDSNKRITEANSNLKKQEQGTDAYQKAQLELNRSMDEQSGYLDELRDKYPELYQQILNNTDGTVNLAKAQELYNQKIRDAQLVNYFLKQGEGFWTDGFRTNLEEYQNALTEMGVKSRDANAAITSMLAQAREVLALNKNRLKASEYTAYSKQLDAIAKSSDNASERLRGLLKIQDSFYTRTLRSFNLDIDDVKSVREYSEALSEAISRGEDLEDNITEAANRMRSSFDLATEDGKRRAAEAAAEIVRQIENVDDTVRDFVAQKFTLYLGIQVNWRQADGNLNQLFNDWRDQIAGLDDTNIFKNTLKNTSSIKDFADGLVKSYADVKKQIDANNNALKAGSVLTDESKKKIEDNNVQLKAQKKDIEEAAAALGVSLETEKERNKAARNRSKQEKELLDAFKRRIRLIKEAGEEYKKLREYESVDTSVSKVKDMFKDTEVADVINAMSGFEPKDLLKGYDAFVSEARKLGKEATRALQDEQRPIEREIVVKLREDSIEYTKEQIDRAFADYDLSKELAGTGLDRYEISAVFGKQITSLKELVDYMYKDVRPKLTGLGTEQQQLWDETYKKITDLQAKELEEQTKNYVKYLTEQYSESTKIILKLQDDIQKVQNNPNFTQPMKDSIIENLRKEASEAQQKLAWEEFSGSSYYIEMFDNLDAASTTALENMRDKIESIKGSLKDLPASDVKDIVEALNNIDDELVSRNPYKALANGMKELLTYTESRRDLEQQINDLLLHQDIINNQMKNAELSTNNARKKYYETVAKNGENSPEALQAEFDLKINETELNRLRDALKAIGIEIDNVKEKENKLSKSQQKVIDGLGGVANDVQMLTSSLSSLKSGMESLFGLSDEASDVMDALIGFGEGLNTALTGAKTAAEGIASKNPIMAVSGAVSALGGVFSALGSLFSLGDKKREHQIQREMELVESLQRSYEKLEKAINDAYSVNTLKMSTENALNNIDRQIQSYQNMIAAEQDKKKSDDDRIREWRNAIESLKEQRKELEDAVTASLGGFGSDANIKSAAQEFADAWLEAFKETGNGLDALTDKWDEYVQKIIASKLMLAGTEKYLKPIMDYIDAALADYDWSAEDQEGLQKYIDTYMPALSKYYEGVAKSLGVMAGGDSLTSLEKGIQGITADQADALAAILESVRYFEADTNTLFHEFMLAYQSADTTTSNPIVVELQTQTELIRSINSLLGSVIKNVPTTGRALKVQIV